MEKISVLRERLQGPRRPYDTLYGRYVMRRASIYLTILFSKLNLSPKFVTFLSVLCGLLGVCAIFTGHWCGGILLVNGWYLLDHSDGELARLQARSSLGGLYFDTIANALIPPFTFLALGADLERRSGEILWFMAGSVAAIGYEMLLIIPFCEAAVLLQWAKASSHAPGVPSAGKADEGPLSLCLKKIFALLHRLAIFPSALPVLTLTLAGTFYLDLRASLFFAQSALLFYAFLVTLVWALILIQTIATDKLDKKYAAP